MLTWRSRLWVFLVALLSLDMVAYAQQPSGAIRGVVRDEDFNAPLVDVQVLIVETGEKVSTSEGGAYRFLKVPAGKYTLVFSKQGFIRQPREVVVSSGKLSEVNVWLAGEFNEMEEFVVEDPLLLGGGSEAALLEMRFESPALMDSISSDLMSQAGASDAASALNLVSGATVEDGKFAVIRGLPDRYVSSQMNGVPLPTADEDKRAVELDQFPSAVIESIQVTKTFTPDQQGEASGGAVDVRLKEIPDETIFELKAQISANSQVYGEDDFLTHKDSGNRSPQWDNLGESWTGAVGTTTEDAPTDYKLSGAAGSSWELDNGMKLGGFASLYYERDSSYFDDGKDDSYWVQNPGDPLTPVMLQGTDNNFRTALFDVTEGSDTEEYGGMARLGMETENHAVGLTYLYTKIKTNTSTLAEDTRGKEYFFPGYDPDDPMGTGNDPDNRFAAPYIRTETLEYDERTTHTLQLDGQHTLPFEGFDLGSAFAFGAPELNWTAAKSHASLDQPDKRQFGAIWLPASYDPGGPFDPPHTDPPVWLPYKPDANYSLGNLQRIWKSIEEDSDVYSANLKLPYEQWGGEEGYLKFGWFYNDLHRDYSEETFSNFNDNGSFYNGDWDDPWSHHFPDEDHPITESKADVDYDGKMKVTAWYGMTDLPVTDTVSLVGGVRLEKTDTSIVNDPEAEAVWYPPGATSEVTLNPGDGDVDFDQNDALPSIGLVYEPLDELTFRASYSKTVARQTFKELTPIIQQEFLGGPIFIGNPDLDMSKIDNYDLRLDYVPYEGGLLSASWFHKDIEDPIEYVQRLAGFTFTTVENYPKGKLTGYELEARQSLGRFTDKLDGVALGANATWINSNVTLPDDVQEDFMKPDIDAPTSDRDMTNAPDHLYNLFLTYDLERTGTRMGVFYTVKGDTLVAGAAAVNGIYVPDIYEKEYGTLNVSVSQVLGDNMALSFGAKNLLDPEIETVYRSDYTDGDTTHTSYTKGREYTLTLTVSF